MNFSDSEIPVLVEHLGFLQRGIPTEEEAEFIRYLQRPMHMENIDRRVREILMRARNK